MSMHTCSNHLSSHLQWHQLTLNVTWRTLKWLAVTEANINKVNHLPWRPGSAILPPGGIIPGSRISIFILSVLLASNFPGWFGFGATCGFGSLFNELDEMVCCCCCSVDGRVLLSLRESSLWRSDGIIMFIFSGDDLTVFVVVVVVVLAVAVVLANSRPNSGSDAVLLSSWLSNEPLFDFSGLRRSSIGGVRFGWSISDSFDRL